jgi:hypothetical protein
MKNSKKNENLKDIKNVSSKNVKSKLKETKKVSTKMLNQIQFLLTRQLVNTFITPVLVIVYVYLLKVKWFLSRHQLKKKRFVLEKNY